MVLADSGQVAGLPGGDDRGDVPDTGGRIETERGPWVQALVAAGYRAWPVNPLQVPRFRERLGVSGAKSDTRDAHVLADMVRTFDEQLRPIAGDSPKAETVKVVTRAHKALIWERTVTCWACGTRCGNSSRPPWWLSTTSPPSTAAAARNRPGPRVSGGAEPRQVRGGTQAGLPPQPRRQGTRDCRRAARRVPRPTDGRGHGVRGHRPCPGGHPDRAQRTDRRDGGTGRGKFAKHPDAKVYLSQPGLGVVLGARVLAEFGDDKKRDLDAKARPNYAGTSPITASPARGRSPPLGTCTTTGSSPPSACKPSPHSTAHPAPAPTTTNSVLAEPATAPRCDNSATELVGILHSCLKTGALYDETKAWPPAQDQQLAA
jgi:Transposase